MTYPTVRLFCKQLVRWFCISIIMRFSFLSTLLIIASLTLCEKRRFFLHQFIRQVIFDLFSDRIGRNLALQFIYDSVQRMDKKNAMELLLFLFYSCGHTHRERERDQSECNSKDCLVRLIRFQIIYPNAKTSPYRLISPRLHTTSPAFPSPCPAFLPRPCELPRDDGKPSWWACAHGEWLFRGDGTCAWARGGCCGDARSYA